jgi:N-acetylmuramoyl-L-alanine amidase
MWSTEDVPKVYLTALCAWREARGCSDEAIRGVLHVIKNRVDHPGWWGHSVPSVVLKPEQFSSFNKDDPNATKFPPADDPVFANILTLTDSVLNNQDQDLTNGAVNYHDSSKNPPWADPSKRTALILPFSFYRA